jgi:hypothetical protein
MTEAAPRTLDALVKALELIDDGCCERLRGGYRCETQGAWTPDAEFTNDRWCDSCIAHAALALARGEERQPDSPRAVNAHDEMLAALIAVRGRFQNSRFGPDESAVLDRVNAAIEAGKEKWRLP